MWGVPVPCSEVQLLSLTFQILSSFSVNAEAENFPQF